MVYLFIADQLKSINMQNIRKNGLLDFFSFESPLTYNFNATLTVKPYIYRTEYTSTEERSSRNSSTKNKKRKEK